MVLPRLIPCLDCRDGRVVKGVRFQGLRDAGDPQERAARYDADGADELVLLDVSATPEGREAALDTVRRVREVLTIPLTVGGGVRTIGDAERLLAAGADRVAVNTAAVERPELLTQISTRLGAQCTVLALDAARAERPGNAPSDYEVVVQSGRVRTGRCALEWAATATAAGAGEILLTSWDRDGTRTGYDLELIRAISEVCTVPVIASGGAATALDLAAAIRAGASAVLVASMLHDGDTTVNAIKSELADSGVEVRQ